MLASGPLEHMPLRGWIELAGASRFRTTLLLAAGRAAASLVLVSWLAAPVRGQQWVHISFAGGPIDRMLSAPIGPQPPSVNPLGATALVRSRLELAQLAARAEERLEVSYRTAKARSLPPPCLWPDTKWRLFNPALDPWGFVGIPCPVSPVPDR